MATKKQDEPVITVPNLAPKLTMGGYVLRWEQEGLEVLVALDPENEKSSAAGYRLHTNCYSVARPNGQLGPQQSSRATLLEKQAKTRMIEEMEKAGWRTTGGVWFAPDKPIQPDMTEPRSTSAKRSQAKPSTASTVLEQLQTTRGYQDEVLGRCRIKPYPLNPQFWIAEFHTWLHGNTKGWKILREERSEAYRMFATPEEAYAALQTLRHEWQSEEQKQISEGQTLATKPRVSTPAPLPAPTSQGQHIEPEQEEAQARGSDEWSLVKWQAEQITRKNEQIIALELQLAEQERLIASLRVEIAELDTFVHGNVLSSQSNLEKSQPAGEPVAYAVYGSSEAKESGAPPAFTRQVRRRSVTFRCEICKNMVTELHLPGQAPRYCQNQTCQREAVRLRVQESRKRKRARQGV